MAVALLVACTALFALRVLGQVFVVVASPAESSPLHAAATVERTSATQAARSREELYR